VSKRQQPECGERLVTDHALVRYMERILGVDTDAIRSQILDCGRDNLVRRIGSGAIKAPSINAVLVVQSATVVTITQLKPASPKPARPKMPREEADVEPTQ
jgi:hypothetical protein